MLNIELVISSYLKDEARTQDGEVIAKALRDIIETLKDTEKADKSYAARNLSTTLLDEMGVIPRD